MADRNMGRHADAGSLWIRVACKKSLRGSDASGRELLVVSIEDDDRGFPETGVQPKGLGLLGIEECVHSIGGDLLMGNRFSGGMFLRAHIPFSKGEHDG